MNALRVFEAVARTGSFTTAANELFITQSAVSHQVRALEEWLGQPLFERAQRKPRLLAAGQALAPVLTGALADIQLACRRLRDRPDGKHLVIAVIPSIATCWLIPRLAEFRQRHPDIRLRIVYAIHGQQTDVQDADLAIVYANDRPSGENVVPFLQGAAAPVCSTSFAEGHGPFSTPSDLTRAPLLHDTNFTGWQQWYRKAGVEVPVLDQSPVFEDFNLLRAATLAGQGISLCPLQLIADDLNSGRLVQVSDVTVNEGSGYYIRQPGAAISPQGQLFRDWLVATAEDV